jgi:hypothetical protein
VDVRPAVLHVRNGEIVEDGSWVYLWLRPDHRQRVIYVGATGLPPAVRTWLHLHHEDPEIGRVASGYPAAGGALDEDFGAVADAVLSELNTQLRGPR